MSDRLSRALAERGYRLTPARRLILSTLADSGGHLSADDLTERVRRQADIGRMTV